VKFATVHLGSLALRLGRPFETVVGFLVTSEMPPGLPESVEQKLVFGLVAALQGCVGWARSRLSSTEVN
jgi:hypothetical protein